MQRPSIVWIITLLVIGISTSSCGPKCPEIKTAMSQSESEYDDALRINKLVEKRKLAIKETETGGLHSSVIKRIQFSVTAYELAINSQMRIVALAELGHKLYDENIEIINETRCMLDKILEADDDQFEIKTNDGSDIQKRHAALEKIFRRECEVQKNEFKSVLKKGVEAKAPPKAEKKAVADDKGDKAKDDKEDVEEEEDDDEDDDDEDDDDDDSLDFLR
jgi:hypothetical protein